MSSSNQPYISKGQVLSSPPWTARLRSMVNQTTTFVGLYLTTLFSLDPYEAAASSSFNTRSSSSTSSNSLDRTGVNSGRGGGTGWGGGWFGGGGHGGSGPGGPGGSGGGSGGGSRRGGGKRLGTVDDVRGPECGSCG